MEKIIFATGNQGKMREIRSILSDINVEVLSMAEAGIEAEIEENGTSFEENALMKARAIAARLSDQDVVVLADDSGLEVDYLNKEPGIYSARYMGEDTSYEIKTKILLIVLREYLRKNGVHALYVRLQRYLPMERIV